MHLAAAWLAKGETGERAGWRWSRGRGPTASTCKAFGPSTWRCLRRSAAGRALRTARAALGNAEIDADIERLTFGSDDV